MEGIPVYFRIDAVGRLFVTFVTIVWVSVGFYSFVYMKHEGEERRFFGFFLLVYGVLVALDFAGNIVTMYLFYELMTLCSMPLVMHNGSREAIMAALKYLFYSMCGADPRSVWNLLFISLLRYTYLYGRRGAEFIACIRA